MVLQKNASIANVKASIEKYIKDNLGITEGLDIDYEETPFEVNHVKEWINPRIIGIGGRSFHRQTGGGLLGQTSEVLLNINIFVNRELTQKTNRIYELRDLIYTYFTIGKEISLYDFNNDDFTNILQTLVVREIITDQVVPAEDYSQYVFACMISWLEQWVK